MSSIADKESLVLKLIQEKKSEEAINLLYELICTAVEAKEFKKADAFRDRIYLIDSMAIAVIVKANDLIEKSKSEAIDKRHTALWTNLYSKLSQDEANALFYAFEEKIFETDENIVKQGELNPYLFFIEKGEIKIFYTVKDKNIFVKNLGQGFVAGRDAFFSASVSTVSMSAVLQTHVRFLNKDFIAKWKKDLPLLESKLNDFCFMQDKISSGFSGKKLNRRVDERFLVTAPLTFQVLKSDGTLMEGNFRGIFFDISKGGLSFLIKSATKDTANRLLGRKIKMVSNVKVHEHEITLDTAGMVIAVEFKPLMSLSSNDYIIHVKTDEKIRF